MSDSPYQPPNSPIEDPVLDGRLELPFFLEIRSVFTSSLITTAYFTLAIVVKLLFQGASLDPFADVILMGILGFLYTLSLGLGIVGILRLVRVLRFSTVLFFGLVFGVFPGIFLAFLPMERSPDGTGEFDAWWVFIGASCGVVGPSAFFWVRTRFFKARFA